MIASDSACASHWSLIGQTSSSTMFQQCTARQYQLQNVYCHFVSYICTAFFHSIILSTWTSSAFLTIPVPWLNEQGFFPMHISASCLQHNKAPSVLRFSGELQISESVLFFFCLVASMRKNNARISKTKKHKARVKTDRSAHGPDPTQASSHYDHTSMLQRQQKRFRESHL